MWVYHSILLNDVKFTNVNKELIHPVVQNLFSLLISVAF